MITWRQESSGMRGEFPTVNAGMLTPVHSINVTIDSGEAVHALRFLLVHFHRRCRAADLSLEITRNYDLA
jgi:hypothetical protein